MLGKTQAFALIIAAAFFLATVLFFSPNISSQPTETTCNGCADCSNKLNGSFDVVTLTANIIDHSGICIIFNANDTTFNGNDLVIDGTGTGAGIFFSEKSGLTIENVQAFEFDFGIYGELSNNITLRNNLALGNDLAGIYWENGNNFNVINNGLQSNSIDSEFGGGIQIESSNNNLLLNNIIIDNWNGIQTNNVDGSTISENLIQNNLNIGISLTSSNENKIFYNNIVGQGIPASDNGNNNWHNGYPGGGNYWSNLEGCVDIMSGPDQNLSMNDGICDAPFQNGGDLNDIYPWTRIDLLDYIPVLEPVPDIVAAVNNIVRIELNGSDPDNGTLTYNISDARFVKTGPNVFEWQTQTGDEGNYSFIASVFDGTYNAVRTVNVEVIDAFSVHHFLPDVVVEDHVSSATAQMIIKYLGNATATQDEIYNYGIQYNLPENSGLIELDPYAMDKVLGHFDPYDSWLNEPYNQYDNNPGGNPFQGYNFVAEAYNDITEYMRDIAHWMDYPVPEYPGSGNYTNPAKVPPALPLFGSYDNWVSVNGFAADADPLPNESNPFERPDNITIYGFWMTDPNIGIIGKNKYVTAEAAESIYLLPVNSSDQYNGKYVQIAEPPEVLSDSKVIIAKSKKNTGLAISLRSEQSSGDLLTGFAVSKPQAAGSEFNWESIIPSYLLSDPQFSEAFENTEMGKRVLVHGPEDYYIVNFEKITLYNGGKVSVSVIIGSDGTFREATWVDEPQEYDWLTRRQAVREVRKYLRNHGMQFLLKIKNNKIRTEFIWEPGEISTSPFEPFWKVTVGNMVFYVKHDGTLVPPETRLPVSIAQLR